MSNIGARKNRAGFVVLGYEREYRLGSFEKMATAFLRYHAHA